MNAFDDTANAITIDYLNGVASSDVRTVNGFARRRESCIEPMRKKFGLKNVPHTDVIRKRF